MSLTTTTIDHRTGAPGHGAPSRAVAWTGIAFVVCFIGGVASSSPPDKSASDRAWIANYTGTNKMQHTVTGVLLVLAGICLASFLTGLWRRIADAQDRAISPLPLVTAGIAAATMAVGGVVMGGVAQVVTNDHSAGLAELFRVSNGLGFVFVAIGAMPAVALTVVCLSVQGRAAGVLSNRLAIFGYVTAIALLAALAFLPIVVLLIWVVVVAVAWLRSGAAA